MDIAKRKYSAAWLVGLLGLGFLLYYPGIDVPYYADDFYFFSSLPCSHVVDQFLGKGRSHSFYRPVEAATLACIQDHSGLSTIPIHILAIFLHSVLCYLVFLALLDVGSPVSHAVLGSLFMLFSQANVSAVLGNDTLSQIMGTLLGCFSLLCLYRFFPNERAGQSSLRLTLNWPSYFISVLAFTLALFSKESSVSFLPLIFAVMVLRAYTSSVKATRFTMRSALFAFLPYLILFSAYFATRRWVGTLQPSLGPGPYNFNIGLSIVRNLVQLFAAATVPVSTVTTFTSISSGRLGTVSLIALASILFIGLVGYGLWQSRHGGSLFALGVFGVIALFPMVMMNHVSELYAYNSMSFVAMIVGIGAGTVVARASTPWRKQSIAVALLLVLTGHVFAVREKASLMRNNGMRASQLLERIQPYAERVSQGGELLLVNPKAGEPEYSVFLTRGFNVLATSRIKSVANREDITVKIIEESELEQLPQDAANTLILHLNDNGLGVVDKSVPAPTNP